jgi:AraC family transcriptional regulator
MHRYADQSLAAAFAEPSMLVASSTEIGWSSALIRIYRSAAVCDPFETVLTPDQTVVVHLSGSSEVKTLADGRWHTGIAQPGSVGLTPPNHRSRLRWRALEAQGYVSAHLHVPQGFFDEASDHHARPGVPGTAKRLNSLAVNDRAVAAIIREIVDGMAAAESELFLQAAMYRLALRLLDPLRSWDEDYRRTEIVDDRRIRRAIEYMSNDLAAPIDLSMIAREAAISKFHFVRSFRAAVGMPPHAFLTQLRLTTARHMLRTTDLPIAEIARLVGYETPRNFSTAFGRHFGFAPRAARRV